MTQRPQAPRSTLIGVALAAAALFGLGWWLLFGGIMKRPGSVPANAESALVDALPLRFDRPLDVETAPGDDAAVYVVSQAGQITRAPLSGQAPSTFVDLGVRVLRQNNEEGLLGLAFAPDYAQSGHLYVYFSAADPLRNVVAELTAPPSAGGARPFADPASLRVVLDIPKPYGNHNGGCLAFGRDGMLYVSVGDGGAGGDPHGNAQDLGSLLGKVLRLDVRPGAPSVAPADNPFARQAGARPEIWAYGLRNPWRMAFDPATGELWAGDVGQEKYEEVTRIERGGNHGWNHYEGLHRYGSAAVPEGVRFVKPVLEYGHGEPHDKAWNVGQSVTGGRFYRGKARPDLVGKYVFGDFAARRVWAMDRDTAALSLVSQGECAVASFGETPDHELLLACFDGVLRRLAPWTR